jgi:L-rhamnose mutarotase
MQRMGMMIGLKPEKVEEYKRLHRAVWPEILSKISECNITNYSIFLKQPENILFGYWEYVGEDFEADMKAMADDPRTQEWWSVCEPCQEPVSTRKQGEWWAMMEQVFHLD